MYTVGSKRYGINLQFGRLFSKRGAETGLGDLRWPKPAPLGSNL